MIGLHYLLPVRGKMRASVLSRRSKGIQALGLYGKFLLCALLVLPLTGCGFLRSGLEKPLQADNHQKLQKEFNEKNIRNGGTHIDSIWDRIRGGERIYMRSVNGEVRDIIRNYQEHPRRLERLLERSALYIAYVVDELERHDLPRELALLPVVESAYDPFAYSAGRASGMWQFIPGTAKFYGLRRDTWYDGRRDVRASTQAALRYLADLYENSDGDWLHAIAGYNAGWGAVSRAIEKNRRRGRSLSAWDLPLPSETQAYVPRFCALTLLVRNPEKYGVRLPPIPERKYFAPVNVGSQIDLAIAAELADISIDEIYYLNPGFSRWATPPQGPHELLVPKGKRTQFLQALEELPFEERLGWAIHRVVPGDTLSRIAREYDTTVEALRKLNNMEGDWIRAGSDLLIPAAAHPPESYVLNRNSLEPVQSARQEKDALRINYTVRKGDSLWGIARRYGIRGYGKITDWNSLSPRESLHPGQRLVLWIPRPSSLPSLERKREPVIRKVNYRVRRGDSLSKIATYFGVKVAALANWNSIRVQSVIHPGQILIIYVDALRNH